MPGKDGKEPEMFEKSIEDFIKSHENGEPHQAITLDELEPSNICFNFYRDPSEDKDEGKGKGRAVEDAAGLATGGEKVIVRFMSQKNQIIDKDQTPAGRYGKSYMCAPCGYMRGKIVSITPEPPAATQLSNQDTFTVSCPECFATYSTKSGRGKVSPEATDADSITGLVEYQDQGAKIQGKTPWVCLSCLGPHDDPGATDTKLQILYINNRETKKCVGCTTLLKKDNPGERVKGNTHFVTLGQRRRYGP